MNSHMFSCSSRLPWLCANSIGTTPVDVSGSVLHRFSAVSVQSCIDSVHGHAAVHHESGAGDERRGVGGEEEQCCVQFGLTSQPAEDGLAGDVGEHLLRDLVGHLGG